MDLSAATQPAETPLIVTPRPFSHEVRLEVAAAGSTILELIDLMEARLALEPALRPYVQVAVGDQVVPQHAWPRVRPKPGVPLFVNVVPRGSNPLRTILQIAVIAISFWAPAAFGLQGLAAAFTSAAINVGGCLSLPFGEPHP